MRIFWSRLPIPLHTSYPLLPSVLKLFSRIRTSKTCQKHSKPCAIFLEPDFYISQSPSFRPTPKTLRDMRIFWNRDFSIPKKFQYSGRLPIEILTNSLTFKKFRLSGFWMDSLAVFFVAKVLTIVHIQNCLELDLRLLRARIKPFYKFVTGFLEDFHPPTWPAIIMPGLTR